MDGKGHGEDEDDDIDAMDEKELKDVKSLCYCDRESY